MNNSISESELLEHLNYLSSVFFTMMGIACALMASLSFFSNKLIIALLLVAVPGAFLLLIYIFWKGRLLKRMGLSTLIFGRRFPFQEDGFMEMVMSQAMTISFQATLVSIIFMYSISANRPVAEPLPADFCLLTIAAILTGSYGISYLVQYRLGSREGSDA
ncbi:hypothetical protein SCOR_01135 [Sulfidibacter corallicola]|uniref:Uncharacterized protein n=1 Tax=Sulfidibacter corallicola TaxID=2818388 RepID=A0A8A4TFK3_SULCO|nr:hypothetical protein [Sulfidibacter corallicola]QTD48869.1 hypothetical protein J3U87_25075 [Sulfidibacter corallicola]